AGKEGCGPGARARRGRGGAHPATRPGLRAGDRSPTRGDRTGRDRDRRVMNEYADRGVEPNRMLATDPDDTHDGGAGGSEGGYDPYYLGGARKKQKKRGFSGCLAVLVALAVVVGGAYVAGTKGFHFLKDHLSHAADYDGPGHGKVTFEVK